MILSVYMSPSISVCMSCCQKDCDSKNEIRIALTKVSV